MTEMTIKETLYGTICHKREMGRSRRIFTPLNEQPVPSEVISLHRAYVKMNKVLYISDVFHGLMTEQQRLSNILEHFLDSHHMEMIGKRDHENILEPNQIY